MARTGYFFYLWKFLFLVVHRKTPLPKADDFASSNNNWILSFKLQASQQIIGSNPDVKIDTQIKRNANYGQFC